MALSRVPPSDKVLPELATICGPGFARPARAGDTIAEVPAHWVAAPGTIPEVTATLRLAMRYGLTVAPRGAGTKLDWGSPPARVDLVLDTSRLAGVWRHSAEELPEILTPVHSPDGQVVKVGAGTPMRAVQAALARTRQRVALDPPCADATVGGVIATDEAGPLRHCFGPPREQLVSFSFVLADGTVADSPDQIECSSTGQDLDRLLFGSYGALGILVSATFRVHPAPAARIWVSRSVRSSLEVPDLVGEVLADHPAPAAVEVDLSGGSGTLALLLEESPVGEPAGRLTVRAERVAAVLGEDALITAERPAWWGRYPFGAKDVALRLAVPISDLHSAVHALREAAQANVLIRGSAGMGVVHACLPGDIAPERVAVVLDAVRGVLAARGGSCVVLAAPARVRAAVDIWGDVPGLALLRQVKQCLDPDRRLAPGRFPGGL